MIERADTRRPLTQMQVVVATLLGLRYSYAAIGGFLHVKPSTIETHVRDAARKIPGDFPAALKVACWARGASLGVLTGAPLRAALTVPNTPEP